MWIRSFWSNATLIEFISGHSDISFFSPSSTPRVLDNPEIVSSFCSITNDQYSMVQNCGAMEIIVNTTRISGDMISIDSYRDWTVASWKPRENMNYTSQDNKNLIWLKNLQFWTEWFNEIPICRLFRDDIKIFANLKIDYQISICKKLNYRGHRHLESVL